uniref:Uncharacterized protein n=1 Tax=Timema poppense TaxID=170557 RepID=A0A7R9HAU2_TIMPO|nr:unnamed protein product [Timema poppensis]
MYYVQPGVLFGIISSHVILSCGCFLGWFVFLGYNTFTLDTSSPPALPLSLRGGLCAKFSSLTFGTARFARSPSPFLPCVVGSTRPRRAWLVGLSVLSSHSGLGFTPMRADCSRAVGSSVLDPLRAVWILNKYLCDNIPSDFFVQPLHNDLCRAPSLVREPLTSTPVKTGADTLSPTALDAHITWVAIFWKHLAGRFCVHIRIGGTLRPCEPSPAVRTSWHLWFYLHCFQGVFLLRSLFRRFRNQGPVLGVVGLLVWYSSQRSGQELSSSTLFFFILELCVLVPCLIFFFIINMLFFEVCFFAYKRILIGFGLVGFGCVVDHDGMWCRGGCCCREGGCFSPFNGCSQSGAVSDIVCVGEGIVTRSDQYKSVVCNGSDNNGYLRVRSYDLVVPATRPVGTLRSSKEEEGAVSRLCLVGGSSEALVVAILLPPPGLLDDSLVLLLSSPPSQDSCCIISSRS